MEEQNTYYGSYEESERKNPLIKILLIAIVILIVLVLAIILIKSLTSKSNETLLLNAAKTYYEDTSKLPTAEGECATVTLDYLIKENKISNAKNFNSCDNSSTSVKVCKLKSGKYQYTPFLTCNTKDDTFFSDYKVGTEKDLVENKSDVRFKFLPEFYSTSDKYYYPNDKLSEDEVNELYLTEPSSEYKYKGKAVSNAAKWYKEVNEKSYWNNGGYSSTAPAGYPSQGEEGQPVTKVSLTSPGTAGYRTIREVTVYRSKTSTKPTIFKFECSAGGSSTLISVIPCSMRSDSYKTTIKALYTCDKETIVDENTKCAETEWTAWTTTKCTKTASLECESKVGYEYTDKTWKWYVDNNHKSYYPSGSAVESGEKTYYVSAPAEGYKKDTSTVTTAYRFYKLVENANGTEGEWIKLSDDYLELEEMLEIIKNSNEEIKSLSDLQKDKKFRYSTQIEYANRK